MEIAQSSNVERRIRTEYTEWPQLALTQGQVCRLWSLPQHACETTLTRLVADGFLEHVDGVFCRRGLGRRRPVTRRVSRQAVGPDAGSPFAAERTQPDGIQPPSGSSFSPAGCAADARIPA